jgi:putative ATP-dependent endonuclease of OLD family
LRFSRLELTNFRSFGPGKIGIELPEAENLAAVVGANNAGKSNLLEALRLVLGGRRRWEPHPTEFYKLDVTEELRITLYLREPLRRENVFRKEDEVTAFYFRAWQSDRAPDKGQLRYEHRCLDGRGKTYNPPVSIPKSGAATRGDDVEKIRRVPPPAREVLAQLGPVHWLDPGMYRAFDTSGFGPLARLLDIYREDFRSAENLYRVPDGEEIPSSEAFERLTTRMKEILGTPKLREIEQALTRHLGNLLGPESRGAAISVALPSSEDLLADALRLEVQDEPESPVVPAGRLGAGYQSVLRLAILRTYAELAGDARKAVFLIEEPEAYLNPHLRRHFRVVLGDLAEAGHDVFLTTHDPAFAPLTEYRTILRLAKQEGTTEAYRCKDELDFSYEAVAQKLRRGGNAEALFATKVILCEGQDDAAAVRTLLGREHVDLDAASVSVLDCGGVGNLPDYIRLLDSLHIDLYVISDGDATKAAENPDVAERVRTIMKAADGRLFLFQEDIEHALQTEKQRDNVPHLVSLLEDLDISGLDAEHEIRRLRDDIVAFLGESAAPTTPSP